MKQLEDRMAAAKRKRQNWSLDEEEVFAELITAKQVDRLIEAKKYGQGSIFSMIAEEMRKRGYDRNVLQITEKYKKMKKAIQKDTPPPPRGNRCSSISFNSTRIAKSNIETSTDIKPLNGFVEEMVSSRESENVEARQSIETAMEYSDYNYGAYSIIPENHIIETIGTTVPDENVLVDGVVEENMTNPSISMNDADKIAESFFENLSETTNEIINQITEEVPQQSGSMFDDGDGNILLLLPEEEEKFKIAANSLNDNIGGFLAFTEDDMIEEDHSPNDQLESDNKDDIELDPSLNKAKTNYSRALTGFLDRWIATCDNLWESQKAFWDEQRESLKKWEENVLETQRKNNMELVMMCNNTLKSAILKLCSDRKFVVPSQTTSDGNTYPKDT